MIETVTIEVGNATMSPPTLGMRLDAFIAGLDAFFFSYASVILAFLTGWLVCFAFVGGRRHLKSIIIRLLQSSSMKHLMKGENHPRKIFQMVHIICVFFVLCLLCVGTTKESRNEPKVQVSLGSFHYILVLFGMVLVYKLVMLPLEKTLKTHCPPTAVDHQRTQPSGSANRENSSRSERCIVSRSTTVDLPSRHDDLKLLPNETIAGLVLAHKIKDYELEYRLDPYRAVAVRRIIIASKLSSIGQNGYSIMERLPASPSLDYGLVHGANCESVVGYVPIPVGIVGPLVVNGKSMYVPMATTEGCLVASTNRGAKAISLGGGANVRILRDGITRAPCIRLQSAIDAADLKLWCEDPKNFVILKRSFEGTTSFGKLISCKPTVAGRNVYLRLVCFAGDAMGMNMVSKGSVSVIETLQEYFPSVQLVSLSGNMCTDKKAAATNWLEGRGKSAVVEATIAKDVVHRTLKTTVKAIVQTNIDKNLVGSAMAGTIGGFNAHASNMVTAIFLATGQDPAQNVESSNCITLLEETREGNLWISCTMPSIEVGTVGGGTSLDAQGAGLDVVGCRGGGKVPGENAKELARVVAAATMAGELSLLAALAANTLVQAHMRHNRKNTSP